MKIVVTLIVTALRRSICVYSLSFLNMCLMTLNSEHAQKCALSNVSALCVFLHDRLGVQGGHCCAKPGLSLLEQARGILIDGQLTLD